MQGKHSTGFPAPYGLYDPANEKDSCGVGFVAHIKGQRSHQIVLDADQVLRAMDHRGACGCEPNTGDGAGMLTALPHDFLVKVAREELQQELPAPGEFAAGIVFLPRDETERRKCKAAVESIIEAQQQRLVGWRPVPTDADAADVGPTARSAEPVMEMLVVAAAAGLKDDAFERQLYTIRKRASHQLRNDDQLKQALMFYVCSLSTKVIIYKGMLTPDQVLPYFPDLSDPDFTTHLAMVHSRFSTNTFPSWDRAQPNRFMSHNGEINTLRGNVNWMLRPPGSRCRANSLQIRLAASCFRLSIRTCSDSWTIGQCPGITVARRGGTLPEGDDVDDSRSLAESSTTMSEEKRAFLRVSLGDSNGTVGRTGFDLPSRMAKYIGATCSIRNGLRPSRYYVTHDDRVIMASEVGVLLDVDPEIVKYEGTFAAGPHVPRRFRTSSRIISDDELKQRLRRTSASLHRMGQEISGSS